MEQKFCQSCGMPLTDEILGTHSDGAKNEDVLPAAQALAGIGGCRPKKQVLRVYRFS